MGIKDKVLDILFDDEGDNPNRNFDSNNEVKEKRTINTSNLVDTGSIFIDATSPLPKSNNKPNVEKVKEHENRTAPESGYQMSENISPIFGIIDSKNKKNKNISKVKVLNDISNKTFDTASKNQSQTYTSVVISPFFGPIPTKPVKRTNKPRKKVADPFERDINDTGSFDAILDEENEQTITPNFDINNEEVVEETVQVSEPIGDTDRLEKISDKINQIKNEAANIYSKDESNDEQVSETEYRVETIEHENISDLIHRVQNYDGKIEHIYHVQEPQVEPRIEEQVSEDVPSYSEPVNEPIEEVVNQTEQEEPMSFEQESTDNIDAVEPVNEEYSEEITESTSEESVSVDDIFQDQENEEEEKDLFSSLFGDE